MLQLIKSRLDAVILNEGKLLHCTFETVIELGFNDTSTLVGHFVSSPREREKKDRRDSRRDEREGQGRKRNRNESEETEEIKTSPSTLTCYKDSRALWHFEKLTEIHVMPNPTRANIFHYL